MGSKPSSRKAKPKTVMTGNLKRQLAQQEPEKFNISDFDGILPFDSFDDLGTPKATPRNPSYANPDFKMSSSATEPTKLNHLSKIDVSANHRKIKRKVNTKLDLHRLSIQSPTSPQSNAVAPILSSRSERLIEEYTLEPLQHIDPFDRFVVERFDKRKNTSERVAAKTSKLNLFKQRSSPDYYQASRVSPAISTFSDLLTEVKKRQRGYIFPNVKEALNARRRTTGEDASPSSRTPRPSTSEDVFKNSKGKFRIRNFQSEVLDTKTTDTQQDTKDSTRRKSKAEKQWMWKGTYGKLKQGK
mmetsp:Transcript_24875/g.43745  ORF Transcript_24875/g.43745 Transcript_24875/m.43745 type:complete len:300 (+) Transcript_24875:68-967(+)